jgi:uncharacterized protein YbjT (DUF2867 family)
VYAITGVTGHVGGAVAKELIGAGKPVRAIVRDRDKAKGLAAKGAELAVADFNSAGDLVKAFESVEAAFIIMAPNFAPEKNYPEARAIASSLRRGLEQALPRRVMILSSIGCQHDSGLGLVTQVKILEDELSRLSMPVTVLRPTWFMENFLWDIEPARQSGQFASFLQPLDRPFPMVATADVGRIAASAIQEKWTGRRVIEIEGPKRYTPRDVAKALTTVLGRPVEAVAPARDQWEAMFRSQGSTWPEPRIEMLDGFNSGWIEFEGGAARSSKGTTSLESALKSMSGGA